MIVALALSFSTTTCTSRSSPLSARSSPLSASSPWTGVKQLGVSGRSTTANAIAVDPSDQVYAVGTTDGDLDGNTLSGSNDGFITKYSASGEKQWTRLIGQAGAYTSATGVTTDTEGNVFVGGQTGGDLGATPESSGSINFFITKYNPSGQRIWTKVLGVTSKSTVANGLASSSEHLFIAGYTTGGLDGNTLSSDDAIDSFMTTFNKDGDKIRTKQLGIATKSSTTRAVAVDDSENVFITGFTDGNLDSQTLSGNYDGFLTKYNSNGIKQWTSLLGRTGKETYASGCITDTRGHIYITGNTTGALDAASKTSDTKEAFLTQYDSDGQALWTQQLGASVGDTEGNAVSVDSSGNVFVTGGTFASLYQGAPMGFPAYFIAKYDSSGTLLWLKQFGDSDLDTPAKAVAIDSIGNAFITGVTTGGIDGNSISGPGSIDFFITKVNASGTKQ